MITCFNIPSKKLNNSMTVHVFRIVVLIYQICIKYFVIKNIFVNNFSCEIYIRKLFYICIGIHGCTVMMLILILPVGSTYKIYNMTAR